MTRPSWIGQTLDGRYRIDDILGQGGMSAVYKAYDPNLKRTVAVKMIHAHLADDPKFVVRFTEEAAAVAKLRHPNIVQVYDFNHEADLYYMVQEFVEGETLQERLRQLNKHGQRMLLSDAIGIILSICDAAGYAHQRGLIHRDIKPANIMINSQGQAILMDFGIVKIAGGEKHTDTGAVVGTALYLPPELVVGETPDPRSDEYSLAITLFEAVSGRPPFEADFGHDLDDDASQRSCTRPSSTAHRCTGCSGRYHCQGVVKKTGAPLSVHDGICERAARSAGFARDHASCGHIGRSNCRAW